MLQLKLKNNEKIIELNQNRLSIGRDFSNDLVLNDDKVSGFHTNIIRNIDQYEIVDLGSFNGTFINGDYTKGRRRLTSWDIIKLGDIELTFRICKT